MRSRRNSRRGASLIEFSFVAFMLVLVLVASFEFDRMVLVYSSVADSSRAGLRYAIVHGSTRSTSVGDPPSGPSNYSNVVTVVNNFAGAATIDTTALTVTVSYPSGSNSPGSPVTVSVTYPYNPFVILPLSINLNSSTQGIIVF
jgi:Flp pilus assembly protein TadG